MHTNLYGYIQSLVLNYVGIKYKMNLEIKWKINVIDPIIETICNYIAISNHIMQHRTKFKWTVSFQLRHDENTDAIIGHRFTYKSTISALINLQINISENQYLHM